MKEIRLSKALSSVTSRREAEKIILSGNVKVNDRIVTDLSVKVNIDDVVFCNNKRVYIFQPTRMWKFYKPAGYITSTKDTHGRRTIYDLLPKTLPRLITIGRLDYNTEGLLILTNDGDYARKLELPSSEILRIYMVRVFGKIDLAKLDKLRKGLVINEIKYKQSKIEIIERSNSNAWLKIGLYEGKNREIRNMMEFMNLNISKLIRIQYGQYALGNLTKGQISEIIDF